MNHDPKARRLCDKLVYASAPHSDSLRGERQHLPRLELRLAVAAYLARFKGSSRGHTQSDLRCSLA